MVTPSYLTATLLGDDGMTYPVDGYIADVVGHAVNFSNGVGAATATSRQTFVAPVNGFIGRIAVHTGPTVSTGLEIIVGGASHGQIRYTSYLDSLATPGPLRIPIRAGQELVLQEF
jgi:hypothetical protein